MSGAIVVVAAVVIPHLNIICVFLLLLAKTIFYEKDVVKNLRPSLFEVVYLLIVLSVKESVFK